MRLARSAVGLTQTEAALAIGVSPITWNRWETGGITNPKMDHLRAIAKVMNVSAEWLMSGTGEPPEGVRS
jgi:transcriptional regulator with XRE-family HTH domain